MSDYFYIDPSDGGGEARVIGGAWLPTVSNPQHLTTVFGDTPNTRIILQENWKPVTLKRFCPPIKNQNGIGACNAFASVTALEVCRNQKGLDYVELSPGDLYRRVSGGVDRGSLPEDALRELMERGTCTAKNTPPLDWQRINPGAQDEWKNYRITEALWCPTALHAGSALQQGYALNTSVWWYGRDPIDAEGWQQNEGSGGRGGHSICGVSLVHRNGQWGFEIQNSWGQQYGRNGYSILPFRRVDEGAKVFQLWAVRECVQEAGDFPAPKGV